MSNCCSDEETQKTFGQIYGQVLTIFTDIYRSIPDVSSSQILTSGIVLLLSVLFVVLFRVKMNNNFKS